MEWYLKALKNYAVFNGRARRKEYWMFVLFNTIFIFIGSLLHPMLFITYVFAILIPSIAVVVRRLHDVGKSGVFYFVSLIPFVGPIWLLVLLCTEGDADVNKYGPPPKSA